MPSSTILGTGMAVPERIVTNDELSTIMDTSDEWIRTRTGIEQRHWVSPGETGASLALTASKRALHAAGLTPDDIDAIVYATSTPDHFAPGNGVYLQQQLVGRPIPALDVRAQCSGFIYGLSVADAWIRAGQYRRILLVGCEVQSTGMDVSTAGRDTAVIFADGAGAVVLAASNRADRGVLGFDLHSDGSQAERLWVDAPGSMYHPRISQEMVAEGRHFLSMEGREVFRNAVVRMPESVKALLTTLKRSPADIALLIPHQANLRISEMVQKSLGLAPGQVYNNIQRYGNTTAATIPIALDECVRAGRLKDGDLVVMTAFGSGFMWGSCGLVWG
ncbi:MAG TPA: beta-ketoacyl-ACP synthase III [Gemmatimonadales bacterium]|nr:beta-ketoacyl-ACP synthase III [Gemmatimonadales bacterium]